MRQAVGAFGLSWHLRNHQESPSAHQGHPGPLSWEGILQRARGLPGSLETDEEGTCPAGSCNCCGWTGVYQRAPGHIVQSRERDRAGRHKAWALGSPLLTIRSDCDSVTPLSSPSFPHSKVKELAQLISDVSAKSKILRIPPLTLQA